ncbi:MAG TPA: hypothetical protein VHZ99_12590, partial [Steroidobacteraceae bacterium]|nr:hypothetical protein [Steroidobacteraceae bacterium]
IANAALGATASSSSLSGTSGTGSTGISGTVLNGTTFGIGRLKASGLNFAAVVRALSSDSRTNILGTPSVVTRDNQEAKMEVAQEVPFLTGQYSTTNGTGSAFQTIQREDIGTILTVTPTINEGETVLLKLQVESSSLAASSTGAVDLITNKNSISTSVLVKDGGWLVLGGLIQDSVTNTESQVPLLGSIPIIGELFRTRNTEKTKTNFLIFLQPHIMRTDDQAADETDAKYNYVRDQQKILNKDNKLIPFQPFAPADPLPPIYDGRTSTGVLSPDADADMPANHVNTHHRHMSPGSTTTTPVPDVPAPAPAPSTPDSTPFTPLPSGDPTTPNDVQSSGTPQ